MNDERQNAKCTYEGSIIGDDGFRAILRDENSKGDCSGILGTPRVTPTRSGLWIEDFRDAAIDTLLTALIEAGAPRDLVANAAPPEVDRLCRMP